MSKFDDFFSGVVDGVKDIAKGDLKSLLDAGREDAEAFLENSKTQLKRWTEKLAAGTLDKEEFTDLVEGRVELAKMFALTQAGISAARIQRFRDKLIKLVIDKAFSIFLL